MHQLNQASVPDHAVAVHWFEQSSFAIRDGRGTLTLVDPYSPHDRQPERYIQAKPPMNEAEWPAEFILLTHAHSDHTHPETLERVHSAAPNARYLGSRDSVDQILTETSITEDQCIVVNAGEQIEIDTMTVDVVYAKPPEGDPDSNISPPDTTHLGFVVSAGCQRLYFSGDPINTFAKHESLTAPIAAKRPTVGFLTNHPTEGEFPYFDGCLQMAICCGVQIACPSHYACFIARDYDPRDWEAEFSAYGLPTRVIPRNSSTVFGAD